MPEETMHPQIDRRNFLNWFLGTTAGAFAVAILYPLSRYLIPPKVEESTAKTVTLSVKPADIKVNSGEIFRFGSQPAILVRTPGNELKAYSAVCTHLSCIVQYRSDVSHIWCACHNGHYDLNGRNIAGPPPRPLQAYDVNVQGDEIVISRKA
jgi:cytochrome b6-f complex iron-sulfur subunit